MAFLRKAWPKSFAGQSLAERYTLYPILAEDSYPSSSSGMLWSLIYVPLVVVVQTAQHVARDELPNHLWLDLRTGWHGIFCPIPWLGSRVVEVTEHPDW